MKNFILTIFLTLSLVSCGTQEEEDTGTTYVVCSVADMNAGKCLRYMERNIYFAYASGTDSDKNSVFQKEIIQEVLTEVAENTDLGTGYFNFIEVDETFIVPLTESTSSGSAFKSFIQVWPDAEFNSFAEQWNYVPDQNAITVVNGANKRQFYIIVRASCFETNDLACTRDPSVTMGSSGVKGLIARQLAQLVGAPFSCDSGDDNTMCSDAPSENQWLSAEKEKFFSMFDSQLELIRLNPDVFEDLSTESNEAP